jgi:hypothetical protein
MISQRTYTCLLLTLVLSACATAYQQQSLSGGYQEEKRGENKYWLRFLGNGFTKMSVVQEYWDRRASELCAGRKYTVEAAPRYSESRTTTFVGATPYFSNHRYPVVEGIVQCEAS